MILELQVQGDRLWRLEELHLRSHEHEHVWLLLKIPLHQGTPDPEAVVCWRVAWSQACLGFACRMQSLHGSFSQTHKLERQARLTDSTALRSGASSGCKELKLVSNVLQDL